MQDLTKGSITGHLLTMGGFIAVAMLVQTLYFLVDLYFVSHLGKEAVAGVSAASSVMFVCMSFAQAIGVGMTALISRAIGAGEEHDANLLFNQGLSLSLGVMAIMTVVGYTAGLAGVTALGADAASSAAARDYLIAYLPGLVMMFPGAALGSALRSAGVVRTPTMVQMATVLINIVLAPVLIAGWGTGVALGVTGAGLASSIASIVGTLALAAIFPLEQTKMRWHAAQLAPRLRDWWRLLKVGLPSAVEYFLLFLVAAVMYWAIRRFGPEAQAGFGIGGRILQSVMLPAMAIGFATSPIVGQNLGAGNIARIRETFTTAATIAAVIMVALALLMHISPSTLTAPFSPDEHVLAHANLYLQIISWNLIAVGLTTTCSGVFQGLGKTMVSLWSSASRLITFVIPAACLAAQPWAELEQFWWLSVVSSLTQAALSLALLFWVLPKVSKDAPAGIAAQTDHETA